MILQLELVDTQLLIQELQEVGMKKLNQDGLKKMVLLRKIIKFFPEITGNWGIPNIRLQPFLTIPESL